MLYNPSALLDLRFKTLYDIVDFFVIIEGGQTHRNNKREYQFNQWNDKVIYMKLDKMPYIDPRQNESYMRDCLIQGCKDVGEEDYIMISDDDEISNPEAIKAGVLKSYDKFKLRQKLFYYYVNCLQKQEWDGPVLTKKKYFITGQTARNERGADIPIMFNGGWHYSFLGGVEAIVDKLNNFSEQQVNTPDVNNEENLKHCLETGEDIFHRTEDWAQKRFLTLNELDHPGIREWLKDYPSYYK